MTPLPLWPVPVIALAALWPLSDSETNRALFLSLNQFAASHPPLLWSGLTVLGDSLVALCLLPPLLRRHPTLVLAALLAALPALLLTHGLKDGLAMARPYAVLGDQIHVIGPRLTMGAFPSGHTATAFLLATLVAVGLRERVVTAFALIAASLVGLSRIAVGAHWPLDVAGGIACGWLAAMIGWHFADRFSLFKRPGAIVFARGLLAACALVLLFGHNSGYPLARALEYTVALTALLSLGLTNRPTPLREHAKT